MGKSSGSGADRHGSDPPTHGDERDPEHAPSPGDESPGAVGSRARDLEFLLEAGRELTSSLELGAVLESMSRRLLEVVPAWRVGVLLCEEGRERLRLAAGFVRGGTAEVPKGRLLDLDRYPEVERALRRRSTVVVDDVATDELMASVREPVRRVGLSSLFIVPLIVREDVLGVLSIGQRSGERPFTERERSLLEAVANQAAVAIRNAQLYGELQASARELEAKIVERTRRLAESHLRLSVLNEITAAVNVSLDVDRIIEAALTGLARLAGMDRVQVYLSVDGDPARQSVLQLGDGGRLARHEVTRGAAGDSDGAALTTRGGRRGAGDGGEDVPVLLSLEGRWQSAPDEERRPALASHLIAPLVSKDGVVGAIQAFAARPGAHGDAELELLQQVAGEISIALERAQLYRAEQRRSKQFELLSDIGRQLAGAITLENLLPTAARLIQKALGYSTVTVLTLDEAGSELVAAGVAARDAHVARQIEGYRLPVDAGVCGRAVASGRPVVVHDTSLDPDFVGLEGVDTRSELCVPLRLTGETVGVIDMQDERVGAFDETDAAVVRTLGDQLAAALHLSRLFDDLQRHREFTDQVINNLTGGLIVTDRKRVVQVVNHRGAEILHVDRWDLLGRDLLEIIPSAGPLFDYSPESVSRECEITLPDGKRIPVGFSNAFFADTRQGVEAFILTFRELSEIRELQRKVRHAERLATVGTIAAGVAHEIRNPLFGISATAEILASDLPMGSPLVELARGMLEETRRLNALVESLVGYSRPQALHLAPVDPVDLVQSVIAQSAARRREAEVTIDTNLPDARRTIDADADQLRQVLLNLVLNAYDATPGGHVTMTLEWLDDGGVSFVVVDDGPGMSDEQVDKVFDLFYTTKSKGSGMGLAISSKIVEDHGGSITASSPPTGGARFEVRLSAHGGARRDPSVTPGSPGAASPQTSLKAGQTSGLTGERSR